MLKLIDEKNVSRETLDSSSPIKSCGEDFFEYAENISSFIKNNGFTQEGAALKLGMAQSTIANKLRLLRMTSAERLLIIENQLTERHARALLRIGSSHERMKIIQLIVENRLNVERTECLIDDYLNKTKQNFNKNNEYSLFTILNIYEYLGKNTGK